MAGGWRHLRARGQDSDVQESHRALQGHVDSPSRCARFRRTTQLCFFSRAWLASAAAEDLNFRLAGYMELAESSAEGAERETWEEAGAKVKVHCSSARMLRQPPQQLTHKTVILFVITMH